MITGNLNTLSSKRLIGGRYITNTYGAEFVSRLSDEVTFFNSIATATGTTASYKADWANTGVIFINTTAVSGTTPSCTVTVNSVDFVSGNSYTLATSTAITASGFTYITIPQVYGDTLNITYTITGTTPSFTMSISGVFKG